MKKREKEAAKAEKARIAKVRSDAAKTIAKTGPALEGLGKLEADAKFVHIPSALKLKVKSSREALERVDSEARAKLAAKEPLDLLFSIEDVATKAQEGAQIRKSIQTFINAMPDM